MCLSSQLAVNLTDAGIHGNRDCHPVKHPHCTDEHNVRTGQARRTPWVRCWSYFTAHPYGEISVSGTSNLGEMVCGCSRCLPRGWWGYVASSWGPPSLQKKKKTAEANIKVTHSLIEFTLWWNWGEHEGVVITNSGVDGAMLRVPEGPTQDLIWTHKKAPRAPPRNTQINVEDNVKATHCLIEFTLQNPWESTATY